MIPRVDTRMYTNLMLTVIALVLVAFAARELGVGFVGDAQAQERRNLPDLERTDTGVIIDSTIPQTQDVAVAQATSEVANANRDIAAALRELAGAVRDVGGDIRSASQRQGTTPAAGTAAQPSERPTIEVAP